VRSCVRSCAVASADDSISGKHNTVFVPSAVEFRFRSRNGASSRDAVRDAVRDGARDAVRICVRV